MKLASGFPPPPSKSTRKRQRKKLVVGLAGVVLMALVWCHPLALYLMSPQPSSLINEGALVPAKAKGQNQKSQEAEHDLSWFRPEDIATDMPSWMQEYVRFHAAARSRMNQDRPSWKSHRFLLLQCLPGSRKCGGTADRLKPLPLMLWTAHQTKRLLFIKWGRPAELEEFLLPPQDGLDWRVPDWLYQVQEFRRGPRATNVEELQDMASNPENIMVKARVQTHDHGALFYNQHRSAKDEWTFERVYHVCWRAMFTPAPPVEKLIQWQLKASQLQPGQYVGIHIRALYAVRERDPAMVEQWTRNAIDCASQLQPGGPFYLSSDSAHALSVGNEYGKARGVWVASRSGQAQPYHLDKAPRSAKASDFYDTFVDLYLLAMGRCLTYNMGGYGTWALFISPYANVDREGACSLQHHNATGIHQCEWAALPDGQYNKRALYTASSKSLFLPPMRGEVA